MPLVDKVSGESRTGRETAPSSIELVNQLSEISRLSDFVDRLGAEWGLSEDILFKAHLALDELVSNTIKYGYDDQETHHIQVTVSLESDDLIMRVEDDANPFNPLEAPEPDTDAPIEERGIGGLGLFLVRRLMDGISYRRSGEKNIVTIWKAI